MNILGIVAVGSLGTVAISAVMAMAPMMGMPKMDIVDMLSTMFGKPNRLTGWMMHFMMGIVFALTYTFHRIHALLLRLPRFCLLSSLSLLL